MDSIPLTLPFAPEEQWLDIPGYGGIYQVSNFGNVRRIIVKDSIRRERMLSVTGCSRGYPIVGLTLNGVQKVCRVHRLVMLAFAGECPPGYVVNHIDGGKSNNRFANLEYVTQRQNIQLYFAGYKRKEKPAPKGKGHLKVSLVLEIRYLHSIGIAGREIAKFHRVNEGAVSRIVRGLTHTGIL